MGWGASRQINRTKRRYRPKPRRSKPLTRQNLQRVVSNVNRQHPRAAGPSRPQVRHQAVRQQRAHAEKVRARKVAAARKPRPKNRRLNRPLTLESAQRALGAYNRQHSIAPVLGRYKPKDLHLGSSGPKLKIAKPKTSTSALGTAGISNILTPTISAIGSATYHHPKEVAASTVKSVPAMTTGLVVGPYNLARDPSGTWKALKQDYKTRYAGGKKTEDAVRKEGILPYALDFSGGEAVAGRVAGKAAKLAPESRAGRLMAQDRPRLRTSGGKVVKQKTSGNLNVALLQRGEDRLRRRKTAKLLAKREQGARIPAIDASLNAGEVAPLTKAGRGEGRLGHKDVAARKSRGVQAMKNEQRREVHVGAGRNLAGLNKHERPAFKYAMQLGIRDPETARRILTKRRTQIVAARAERGTEIPQVLKSTNDEVPTIDRLISNAEKAFTPKLGKATERERARVRRVARTDPGLTPKQAKLRAVAPQAETLGVRKQPIPVPPEHLGKAVAKSVARKQGKLDKSLIARTREAAKKEGLADPGYFPSSKRPQVQFSAHALGGTKAVADDKHYTGELFRTGREETSHQPYTQAVAKNIKRKHNWNTVAENFDHHAFEWGKNQSIGELMDEMDRRGVDPNTVAFWNPKRYKQSRDSLEHKTPAHTEVDDDYSPAGVKDAVNESTVTPGQLSTRPEDFTKTAGWSAIPKAVHDEIHADTHPSGKYARAWDIAKAKQSRLILGSSPVWAAYQVGANALQTGLAHTGPLDVVKSQLWWKRLPQKEKAAIEPFVGVGPHSADIAQPKMGAAADNQMLNAWRAMKASPVAQRAGKLNPMDALFRFDNAQNNVFRKAVLYSQAKRDAYSRMGKSMADAQRLQAQAIGLFSLGPEKQIRAVLRDQDRLAEHAKYVSDMLGDFTTYTARERRVFARAPMFYGFLRFSLKFAFHTMPVRHPVMTALIANLGRLNSQEVSDMLGGDQTPFTLGKIYFKKDGKPQVLDLTRLNPGSNQLTELAQSHNPGQLVTALPPAVGTALDLAYNKKAFSDKDLRFGGKSHPEKRPGLGTAGRIAGERGLELAYPYRLAKRLKLGGEPQGDDSLVFSPRPTKYKRADIVASIAKQKRRHDTHKGEILREQLLPFLPHPTDDLAIAKRIRLGQGEGKKKTQRRSGGGSLLDRGTKRKSLLDGPKRRTSLLDR